jgi:hypothetical protein
MTDRITLEVDRDTLTGGIQVNISKLDENDAGHGYRLAGPKYLGASESLLVHEVTARDADEIRRYLGTVFPPKSESAERWRDAFEALHARLLRDLPGDASELPPPGDEYWARALDDLLTFAAETAHAAERGA